MSCGGHSIFFVSGCLFLLTALILDVIGVAAPYWIYGETSGLKVNAGLWKECATADIFGQKISKCTEYGEGPVLDWLKAVRAFGLLGIFISTIAIISAILKIRLKDRVFVLIIAIILSFISAVCTIVSIAVYAGKYHELEKDDSFVKFSFAFAFCAVSIVLSVIAGICLIIELAKRSSYASIVGR
ncbi:uncharacterized protein LOC133196570 [Saccostrea echinata]|uniref:uncharacterized protein LOC133196570 n=1 Tax=Saccostrea echinata TaxID=191078 RepID=UPI002A80C0FE|nr:uncharacterized protein LOC133196570 [Saccostrea echinata]